MKLQIGKAKFSDLKNPGWNGPGSIHPSVRNLSAVDAGALGAGWPH
jgi:hypothetical protein